VILSLVIGHLRQFSLMWPLPVLGAVGVALSPTFGAFGVTVVLPMVLGTMLPPAPTLFETALPLHARDVRIARATSALLIILLPCAAWLVAIQAGAYASMPFPRSVSLVMVAVMALLIAYLGEHVRAPVSHNVAIFLRLVMLAAASAAVLYVLPPLVAMSVLTVATVGVYQLLSRAIPAAIPREDRVSQEAWRSVRDRDRSNKPATLWKPLLRLGTYLAWLLPFADFSAMTSGRFSALQLPIVFLITNSAARTRLQWLIRMPLSHRVRLLLVSGPPLLLSSIGLTIGVVGTTWSSWNDRTLQNGAPAPALDTRVGARYVVPLAFWQRVPSGNTPVITTPWGETAVVDTMSRLGITFYNPYSFSGTSSARFRQWQFARITKLVYMQKFTVEAYDAMAEADSLPLPRLQQLPLRILRAGALLCLLLLLIIALDASRDFRLRQHPMLTLAGGSALCVIAAIVAFFDWRGLLLPRHVWLLGAAWDRVLLELAPLLPRSIAGVLCMALLPAVVLYVLLERQHRRAELTTMDFHQPA